ncbi:MAG TPA: ABC transporter ATP-binding protein [Fimbriimonadaceae bacterium]|nr:ABC transporter ATP-binding protein [Fimbriimonadaceae bacterium]
MAVCGETMSGHIKVRDLRKEFLLSTSGAASIKTALLWWRRRHLKHMEVLKGISFEVNPGECVAVIGKNGAGKSTLLSLLARVYKPTSGSIEVTGRMAPLLELGAGFHPDLTGVENIYFNGVILGVSRKEMRERTQAIIDFSEIGEHIEAPTRTYSSGMLARLGFSVAVHVNADILLVDEVLAVGDYEFERKCYAKIDEFRAKGGTILFVSHQMDSVRRVADRCLWLKDGVIHRVGSPDQVIGEYEGRDLDHQPD